MARRAAKVETDMDQLSSLAVARTMKRYLAHPRQALRAEKRAWGLYFARRRLHRMGLTAMYDHMPHAVLYAPDWSDLLHIYQLVRRRKPKVVLEFGSGCSTVMFARALADNHADMGGEAPHLYSVETS